MPKKATSIQLKLVRLVLVTILVVLLVTCVGLFSYEYYTFREASKERLVTLGAVIAANSTAAVAFQSTEDANEILRALKAEQHIVAGALYDTRGKLLAKYPPYGSLISVPDHPGSDGYTYVDEYLEGYVAVAEKGARVGTLYLKTDLEAVSDKLEHYGAIAFLIIGIAIVVAYIFSRQLQKQISGPILDLAKTARIISQNNDYTVRAKKIEDDEIGTLTDAFNQMLIHIEMQNAEITSLNHALEYKINERTKDLELANIELKLKSDFEETIINSSVDVIAVFNRNLEYVILNNYGKEILGLAGKDILGKNILEVFPALKNTGVYNNLLQTFEKGQMIHEAYHKTKSSNRILENYYIPLRDKDGQVYRVLLIGHDITRISEAHDQLKTMNYELEKSNHNLEQYAFVASHDLQEPLRKIQMFSHYIEKKIDDREVVKAYLAKVTSSAVRMSDLIKAVLDYSRLSSAKEVFAPVDLNEIIKQIRTDLELTILEKKARIRCDHLPVVHASHFQLTQLFLNLLSNAMKFCESTPEIAITSGQAPPSELNSIPGLRAGVNYTKVVMKDNGIGFEQRYAEKIFDVFQRLHSKHQYPGTGIGLALCKKIIDNHGGHITVTSAPGKGSAFNLYLPR